MGRIREVRLVCEDLFHFAKWLAGGDQDGATLVTRGDKLEGSGDPARRTEAVGLTSDRHGTDPVQVGEAAMSDCPRRLVEQIHLMGE